jgi:Family of unknown function (DUF5318)
MSMSIGALRGVGDRRGTVDHGLARRMLVNEYKRGRLSRDQVCDAHPELIRAATNVGSPLDQACPICDEQALRLVTYVFGARLPAHGRCVSTAKELAMLNRRRDELSAYVVEACVGCHWHHLRKVIPLGGSNGKSPPFGSS